FLKLDLAVLQAVKTAAETFLSLEKQLRVLFKNGRAKRKAAYGVMQPPFYQLTTQGYDLQFGTNVVGHFYFTQLLPALLSTAQSSADGKARVIHTASSGSTSVKELDDNTFNDSLKRHKLGSKKLYNQSKLVSVSALSSTTHPLMK
ncbi:hypothetical protein B0H14DRAFT_2349393, partial [Mycena olivaceomarginata]